MCYTDNYTTITVLAGHAVIPVQFNPSGRANHRTCTQRAASAAPGWLPTDLLSAAIDRMQAGRHSLHRGQDAPGLHCCSSSHHPGSQAAQQASCRHTWCCLLKASSAQPLCWLQALPVACNRVGKTSLTRNQNPHSSIALTMAMWAGNSQQERSFSTHLPAGARVP